MKKIIISIFILFLITKVFSQIPVSTDTSFFVSASNYASVSNYNYISSSNLDTKKNWKWFFDHNYDKQILLAQNEPFNSVFILDFKNLSL